MWVLLLGSNTVSSGSDATKRARRTAGGPARSAAMSRAPAAAAGNTSIAASIVAKVLAVLRSSRHWLARICTTSAVIAIRDRVQANDVHDDSTPAARGGR